MRVKLLLVMLGSLGLAQHGAAQEGSLSSLIPGLFQSSFFVSDSSPVPGQPNHEAHYLIDSPFLPGGLQQVRSLYTINAAFASQAIVTALTSLPLGSSSGGFVYEFDEEIGTFDRASNSFGPSLAERALTQGRGKFTFGVNFVSTSFDSLEGRSLSDGDIRFYLLHNDCCAPPGNGTLQVPPFEGDILESTLEMSVDSQSVLLFFNYGLTNNLDLSLVLPFSRIEIDATNRTRLQRVSTSANPLIHFFNPANLPSAVTFVSDDELVISRRESASGIGDVAVRLKGKFVSAPGGGLAAGLELRLPTGNELDLLGLGTTQAKASFIASREFGSFAPHFNIGYRVTGDPPDELTQVAFENTVPVDAAGNPVGPEAGGGFTNPARTRTTTVQEIVDLSELVDVTPNELSYAFGFDVAVAPTVTLALDFFGRTFYEAGRLVSNPFEHSFTRLDGSTGTETLDLLQIDERANVNQAFLAFGGKFNLASTFLVSANVLVALNDQGLKDDWTPIIGFDYVF